MPNPVIGWMILSKDEWTMFIADGPGSYNCQIYFTDSQSDTYGEIKIYENNSSTPTR